MVFPIVAPPDPRGPWCVQFWIYIISESSHVNMTYSGAVVLEKKIFKWPHPIFAFLWLSPLWRETGPLHEQFRIPISYGWFVPILIEIGPLVVEKKIFKKFQCIFTLLLLSPLGERQSPSFEQFRIPSPQEWFVLSLVKIDPMVLKKKSKIKSLQTDGRTDGRRAIRIAHLSFQLRWAKNEKMDVKRVDVPILLTFLTVTCLSTFRVPTPMEWYYVLLPKHLRNLLTKATTLIVYMD
jgi:hypothetical protein